MFTRCFRYLAPIAAFVGSLFLALSTVRAEPAFSRNFNGPDTAWQLLESSEPAQVLTHDCIPGGARDNNGIERIAVAATAGQSVQLACLTPPIAALEELTIRVWVKSNRPDIQLGARFKLPRSLDPKTHAIASVIVKGAAYNRPGHWQLLTVNDVPKLLAAQARIMRATPGAAIDPHEAFLDAIVLVVPGDPNGIEVGTDQLEVEGVLVTPSNKPPVGAPQASQRPLPARAVSAQAVAPNSAAANAPLTHAMPSDQKSPVQLQGSLLLVDGKPYLPRVIEWQGESMQFLAERGFNVVALRSPPTAEQIAEAVRHDLWFMCVPPRPDTIAQSGMGQAGDRVMAWSLEDDAIEANPNYAARWAELIRERDVVYGRPIILSPLARWKDSGAADILIARNPRINRISADEYENWFKGRAALARPGTPLWAGFNTQFGDAVRAQVNSLTRTTGAAPAVDTEQLEPLLRVACINGTQGFVFQSSASLSANDPATKRRATTMELVNRRLQLMEPWLAGGKVIAQLNSIGDAYIGVLMYVDRARLLVPMPNPVQKSSPTNKIDLAAKQISFLVPGVPESSQVYYLTPASMRSLSLERVAGGTRLTIPTAGDGLVVITEDPVVVQGLRQRINRRASPTIRLERDIVVEKAQTVFDIDRRIAQLGVKPALAASDAASVNTRLAQLDSLLTSGQLELAQGVIAEVLVDTRRMALEQQRAAGVTAGLQNNALGLNYNRLAEFAMLQRSFENLRGGENLLPGGDFENLTDLTQLGWQHIVPAGANAQTHAELSSQQPEHGTYCLELQAAAPASQSATGEPLVCIVSPPTAIEPGKTVEISGWVRVDRPFDTPGEGLAIVDSLGGAELSLVVSQTSGWQMFRLVRAVPQATELRLTFALTGTGSANVDALMVRTLEQPVARRLPAVPNGLGGAGTSGPMFTAPNTR